ncbi:hypothetical protein Fmac_010825 [Flemingia macrophylla]|uniref:Uncharacterized protein n=1 Tax=Flemingia macrophylla TaxID=520843 RepID=A0ABD1MKS7_9FABA
MGFLDKLWDETLAGPAPESGLGKLRKYNSFPSGGAAQSTAPVDLRGDYEFFGSLLRGEMRSWPRLKKSSPSQSDQQQLIER